MPDNNEIMNRYFNLKAAIEKAEESHEAVLDGCRNNKGIYANCGFSDEEWTRKKNESFSRVAGFKKELGDLIARYGLEEDGAGNLYNDDGEFLGRSLSGRKSSQSGTVSSPHVSTPPQKTEEMSDVKFTVILVVMALIFFKIAGWVTGFWATFFFGGIGVAFISIPLFVWLTKMGILK